MKGRIAAVALVVVAVAAALALLRPWYGHKTTGELAVDRSSLMPGRIVLVLVNRSGDPARVAQVILNDAFVDFQASQTTLDPGDAERITVPYHWIRGEAYDIELMTGTGRTVGYQIEEAA